MLKRPSLFEAAGPVTVSELFDFFGAARASLNLFFRFRHVLIVEPAGAADLMMMMTMSDSSSSILKISEAKLSE